MTIYCRITLAEIGDNGVIPGTVKVADTCTQAFAYWTAARLAGRSSTYFLYYGSTPHGVPDIEDIYYDCTKLGRYKTLRGLRKGVWDAMQQNILIEELSITDDGRIKVLE